MTTDFFQTLEKENWENKWLQIHIQNIKMLLSKISISLQVYVFTQVEQFFIMVPFCSHGILSPLKQSLTWEQLTKRFCWSMKLILENNTALTLQL